jgi:hypothetical protein
MPPIIKDRSEAKAASMVSLVGGIIVAGGVFVLTLLIIGELSVATVLVALVIAGAVGAYVRIADL